jgi:hypothetical protein
MSHEALAFASARRPGEAAGGRRRSKFFLAMSIALLLVAFAGFARTFYLRPLFDAPPVGLAVTAHGAILTAWFVCLAVQTSLVAGGRTSVHRRFGVIGVLIGVGVIVTTIAIHVGIVPHLTTTAERMGLGTAFVASVIWGNFSSLFSFIVLLTSAVVFRHRPETHKRLMLLASISLIGPALVRVATWPIFGSVPSLSFSLGGLIVFLAALVLYDLSTTRRLHPATVLGGAFRIAMWIGAATIAGSEFGQAIVRGIP